MGNISINGGSGVNWMCFTVDTDVIVGVGVGEAAAGPCYGRSCGGDGRRLW